MTQQWKNKLYPLWKNCIWHNLKSQKYYADLDQLDVNPIFYAILGTFGECNNDKTFKDYLGVFDAFIATNKFNPHQKVYFEILTSNISFDDKEKYFAQWMDMNKQNKVIDSNVISNVIRNGAIFDVYVNQLFDVFEQKAIPIAITSFEEVTYLSLCDEISALKVFNQCIKFENSDCWVYILTQICHRHNVGMIKQLAKYH